MHCSRLVRAVLKPVSCTASVMGPHIIGDVGAALHKLDPRELNRNIYYRKFLNI
jgi:hypothetical protein